VNENEILIGVKSKVNDTMIHNYKSALDYLYSFVDYSLTRNLRYSAEKFNLDRMNLLMGLLKNPQNKYPTIHVTGTKGKGSICAMLSSVLIAAGYQTGLYTSPHLHEYTERIQVNGMKIKKIELVNLINEIERHVSSINGLTTFEITTAVAFLYFVKKKVDIAIIEVGLGGRLDATNIVRPLISIISTISKDHEKILGNTLKKIAEEKAGIIKENIPVIIAPQKPRIYTVLENRAKQKNAPIFRTDKLLKIKYITHDLDHQTFSIVDKKTNQSADIATSLLGKHQAINSLSAFTALKYLNKCGFIIPYEKIVEGIKNAKWPGRFEIISKKPVIVLDSAHNIDSISKLSQTTKEYFPRKKIILLFGASEDKNIRGMLSVLLPMSEKIIFSKSTHPRAMDPEKISALCNAYQNKISVIMPAERALEKAISLWNDHSIIVVTGSIFMVAAIRSILHSKK